METPVTPSMLEQWHDNYHRIIGKHIFHKEEDMFDENLKFQKNNKQDDTDPNAPLFMKLTILLFL
jgi:hypothetical protein